MEPRKHLHTAGYYHQPPPPYPQHPQQYPPSTNGYPQQPYGYPPQPQWGFPVPAGYDPAGRTQHPRQMQQQGIAAPAISTPSKNLIQPHKNDVLMGRGGKNNQHEGNEKLRDLARALRDTYKASAKKGKSNMSRDLVQKVRDMDPPGRFLKRNPDTNEWEDVGDDVAREKVSQVLRDAVSELSGSKTSASKTSTDNDDSDVDDDDKEQETQNGTSTRSTEEAASKDSPNVPEKPLSPPLRIVSTASDSDFTASETSSLPAPVPPKNSAEPEEVVPNIDDDDYEVALKEAEDFLTEMDSQGNSGTDKSADVSASPTEDGSKNHLSRKALNVPVQSVPWMRNKRKTNLLDRYGKMNMGLSNSSMSVGSMGPQMNSSRNLGTQMSSRQLMSTGARQMSSRQLSSRQLGGRQTSGRSILSSGSRQMSGRQLGGRQTSGRSMMSMDSRKAAFAMMGESDLSLESLSISGISGHTMRSRSRKNVFMQQYQDMDMGLSDFTLNDSAHPNSAGALTHRPSVIIEGDVEELSDHGSSHRLDPDALAADLTPPAHFLATYDAAGIGTSTSNMTMTSVGTFSSHSRMSRGLFSMGNSMRMDSMRSLLTTDDLQLDMLDDELFDEFAETHADPVDDYQSASREELEEMDEFSSDFC